MLTGLALALAVITTPDTSPIGEPPCSCGDLQAVALALELMDFREARYLAVNPSEYDEDVRLLRRRYATLADAPPVCDAIRFPGREVCGEFLAFNRAYRKTLDSIGLLDRGQWVNNARDDTDRLYRVWDITRDIQTTYYYVTVRREALKRLRDEIGPVMYYSGCLPPPVPVWYFKRID